MPPKSPPGLTRMAPAMLFDSAAVKVARTQGRPPFQTFSRRDGENTKGGFRAVMAGFDFFYESA